MAFDPLRSQQEMLERQKRLQLLSDRRALDAQTPEPGQAEFDRLKQSGDVGTSANGIGGGVENGPQYRALAKKFREMAFGGGGGTTFSADNPYVAHAQAYIQGGNSGPGSLGEIALGRAANDAFEYELASRALEDRLAPRKGERRPRPRAFSFAGGR